MATNGFGSIYPRSYWGVTDAENGFGNVYKDLAGNPTIEITLGEIVLNLNIWRLQLYLTNPAIPIITTEIDVETKLHFYSIDGEEISSQNYGFTLKRQRLNVENNMYLLNIMTILNYNPNMAYAKGELLGINSNGNPLPNPFEVDGTNYLVKLTPSV